ncbi:putative melanophilin-like [Scophthalmus maximus]|uniref:Putative melanophilin-like n=1 Tax=Scophthalmus maximus TaxID=52904 RepID=A0A2U9C9C7_SCOMX|nr:putative melanophilin-like [Scophthalmus maximus]
MFRITDLSRHISTVETILSRLEQQVTATNDQWGGVDLEEQQLRQKLHEMTNDISDHSLTSDEDESSTPHSSQGVPAWRSPEGDARPSRLPIRPTSRTSTVDSILEEEQPQETDSQKTNHMTESVERKGHPPEEASQANFRGSTALLVELEGQVAQAAANVQNAESEVSYIENRIAALNVAGMPVDRRKVSRFVRNSLDRGSLTQRNPVAKPKTRATCAKPVMTQGS